MVSTQIMNDPFFCVFCISFFSFFFYFVFLFYRHKGWGDCLSIFYVLKRISVFHFVSVNNVCPLQSICESPKRFSEYFYLFFRITCCSWVTPNWSWRLGLWGFMEHAGTRGRWNNFLTSIQYPSFDYYNVNG